MCTPGLIFFFPRAIGILTFIYLMGSVPTLRSNRYPSNILNKSHCMCYQAFDLDLYFTYLIGYVLFFVLSWTTLNSMSYLCHFVRA